MSTHVSPWAHRVCGHAGAAAAAWPICSRKPSWSLHEGHEGNIRSATFKSAVSTMLQALAVAQQQLTGTHPQPLLSQADLALIQRVFTDEVMHTILSYLGPYTLGRIACVCQQWRQFAEVSTNACSSSFCPASAQFNRVGPNK